MSDAKLQAARAYIKFGNYAAAKAILEAMPESQTAQRWLKRLAERATSEETPQPPFPEKQQGWEYCVAGPFMFLTQDGVRPNYPVVITYTPTGQQVNPIRVGSPKEADVITSQIAQMGLEGWELVAAGNVMLSPSQMGHMLYFKRPLRD